jgi:hypothetical protein
VDICGENQHINTIIVRRLAAIALLSAACGLLSAQDEDLHTNLGVVISGENVFRGVKRAGTGAEGNVGLEREGWSGGLHYYQPFDGDEPGDANLSAGYAWRVSEKFKAVISLRQNWLANPLPDATRESTEAGVRFSWSPRDDLQFGMEYFRDLRLQADTFQVSAGYSQALPSFGAYLEWNVYAGSSIGRDLLPDSNLGKVQDSYTFYGADLRLPYRLPVWHATVTAGLHFAGTTGQSRVWSPILVSGASRVWADLGLSFDF